MAGHSKWANIKHKKGRADAAKGKLFSRATKEIISAVKQGGPDPKSNSKLRLAIQKAKSVNMPSDNIERNIKKASSSDQSDYFELMYELYGHGGVGLIVDIMTDNKNRIASDMRIATNKRGGSIASPGAVAFNFERQGVIQIPKSEYDQESLFEIAIELGALEFEVEEDMYMILTLPSDLYQIKEQLEEKNIKVLEANLEMIPKSSVECDDETKEKNEALIQWLEDLDDVDAVFHNMSL